MRFSLSLCLSLSLLPALGLTTSAHADDTIFDDCQVIKGWFPKVNPGFQVFPDYFDDFTSSTASFVAQGSRAAGWAFLWDKNLRVPIVGQPLVFTVAGRSCTAITSSSGFAYCIVPGNITQAVNSTVNISATYKGDNIAYNPCSAKGTAKVKKKGAIK